MLTPCSPQAYRRQAILVNPPRSCLPYLTVKSIIRTKIPTLQTHLKPKLWPVVFKKYNLLRQFWRRRSVKPTKCWATQPYDPNMTNLVWMLQSRWAALVPFSLSPCLRVSYRWPDRDVHNDLWRGGFYGLVNRSWSIFLTMLRQDWRAFPSEEHDGNHGSPWSRPSGRNRER